MGTAVTEQKGSLTGNPPAIFDGNRTKSQDFIHEFELWWDLNREHPIMKEPYHRLASAIGYIRGTKVNDWARAYMTNI
jgi:hypothetical protein